jgi:para-nitrobenzyl esterase
MSKTKSMANESVVSLNSGKVIGFQAGGCYAWLGIPYAQAPIGALRLRGPQPVTPWTGVREATSFGSACSQIVGPRLQHAKPGFDENCLYLNIWSPSPNKQLRPVMIWIHGGGFVQTSANMYDGAHFAASHDVVVVTINYRLGVFGFVNFGSLPGGGGIESNLGLRDQIAAMEWVRDNIAGFGGDLNKVTLAGQSAGAVSVSLHMLSQASTRLFHKAIVGSGVNNLIHEEATSRRIAALYAEELKLGANAAEDLRMLHPSQLLSAQRAVRKRLPNMLPASPWFDGDLLPERFRGSEATPTPAIPLMAGFTRDEIRLFELVPGDKSMPMKRQEIAILLEQQLGKERADKILAAYPANRDGQRSLATDAIFGLPTIQFAVRHAESRPSWLYRFDAPNPLLGAAHGLDLWYVWNLTGLLGAMMRGGPLLGRRKALAQRIRKHWAHFIRHGSPGGDWPAFDSNSYMTKLFNLEDDCITSDPQANRRVAWAGEAIVPAGFS